MRIFSSLLIAASITALSLAFAPDASACGGCFHEPVPNETTQVTGHRMIFSISPAETTLWDQFSYDGEPGSFAWVLPVKGTVDIGVSSDALFQNLEQNTQVGVIAPPLFCPPPPYCGGPVTSTFTTTSTTGAGGGSGGVVIVSQEVVGPYETVVLHSTDPNALSDWLTMHLYAIPSDFAPTITAYVNEGFDFLAIKLVPDKPLTSMVPVRVTTPGAGATLPLRMIAAGVGPTTPIALWVLGEGRYQPTNFPWFIITADQLVWDYATSSSNYKALAQAGYDATMGRGWLVESAAPFSKFGLQNALETLVQVSPQDSGYGATTQEAMDALSADLDKLWGPIPPASLWASRIHAELSREALATDLYIGAAPAQDIVSGIQQATKSINAPACPVYPPCPPGTGGSGGQGNAPGGAGGAGGAGGVGGADTGGGSKGSCDGGCAIGAESGLPAEIGALGAALGLAFASRLRRRRR